MSEDGFPDGAPEEPLMEVRIRTLMGTTFYVKVSAAETIADIKKKIYRIEGIPIYQQNLIFQSSELQDSTHLGEAGITNGSVLTLVAVMKGGPISTKRLSVTCEHHVMLKELKELLEHTKDEIVPGSKVSVLVFKEGDVISLLRVIENEDGSYSPYSEKPISPPFKPSRKECRTGLLERFSENSDMMTKIANLRKRMEEVNLKKQGGNGNKMSSENPSTGEPSTSSSSTKNSSVSYKLLSQCENDSLDSIDLKVCERNFEEENEEEIALKDKHRSKLFRLPRTKSKSLYSESKGAYSHTKHTYTRIHKKVQDSGSKATSGEEKPAELTEASTTNCAGSPLPTSNRIHLTRLVLSETPDRPKSTTDGIELEENAQDLWEIHEPASERLKHSATCKVGMMKRRTSHPDASKGEIGGNFEVCSRNFYHMPQLVSSPPQDHDLCDYYFTESNRSPLYGRTSSEETKTSSEVKDNGYGFLTEYSSIQRLKNKCENLFSVPKPSIDELYGYLGCSTGEHNGKELEEKKNEKPSELPPIIKKKSRCSECNKRLNITNMYNCRCGKLFCSQHRYSEVHGCTYDYKLEGRKMLERQNPLVTAEKVTKI